MIYRMNRRDFVLRGLGGLLTAPVLVQNRRQRVIVFLADGLGAEYISASDMAVLKSWGRKGIVKTVDGVLPSVTNAHNGSVCCGLWREEHGITANFFVNEATGEELYLESAEMVLRPTLFEKAATAGITSALLSAKKKTVTLLPRGAKVVMAAETPTSEWVERLGPAPDIYSSEINHRLFKTPIWLRKNRADLGVLYIHTTDYPMHMWPPDDQRSRDHLSKLDALFGELADTASDAVILLTADHGMNHKTRCWDLERAIAARGVAIRTAISAEQDKYLKHHGGFWRPATGAPHKPPRCRRPASNIRQSPGNGRAPSRSGAAT